MLTRSDGPRYKPVVLRLPSLVVFLSLFALSIGLIEHLVRLSRKPSESAVSSPATSKVLKRQDSISSTSTIWCVDAVTHSSKLASLESRYDAICSEFSNVFATTTTDLPASLQTQFSGWWSSYHSITSSKKDVEWTSNTCRPTPYPSVVSGSFELTAGCTSIPLNTWDYFCPPRGEVSLEDASLTTTYSTRLGCYLTYTYQMVIATRTPEPTPGPSTSNVQVESTASLATSTAAYVPPAPTVAGFSTSSSETSIQSRTEAASSTFGGSDRLSESATETTVPSSMADTDTTALAAPTSGATETTVPSSKTDTTAIAAPTATPLQLAQDEVIVSETFTSVTYFQAIFLAPLVAVIIKAVYEIIMSALKMVEPFLRMQKPGGSSSASSIQAQYLRSSLTLDVLRSTSNGRLLPLWSMIMYAIVSVAPPLASTAMSVRTQDVCRINGVDLRCDPVWVVNLKVIRAVEGLLALGACLVVVLMYSTARSSLELPANPSSIAAVAAMLNHEPLLRDVLSIDADADEQALAAGLANRRFWLASHQDPHSGQSRHGLIGRADLSGKSRSRARRLSAKRYLTRRKLETMLTYGGCLVTLAALLGVLLAYSVDSSFSSFNMFFSSQGILPKFIVVGLAALADAQFKNIERTIRVTEPYRRLAKPNSRLETTICLGLNGTCWSNLPICIYHLVRHSNSHMGWQTTVSLVACLSDFNIIVVGGVLFTDSQTRESFLACSYIAIIITGLMLLVLIVTMVWWRRDAVVGQMPRRPETIAVVMSYLCGSEIVREWMTADFRIEQMRAKERDQVLAKSGRKIMFGKMHSDVDGRVRWMVDFEHLDQDHP